MRLLFVLFSLPIVLFAQPKLSSPLNKIKMGKTSMRRALKLFPFEFKMDTIVTGHANFGTHCMTLKKILYKNEEHGISLQRSVNDKSVTAIFISENYKEMITDSFKLGEVTKQQVIDYYSYSPDTSEYSSRKTEIEFKNNARVWFRFKENKLYSLRIRTSY